MQESGSPLQLSGSGTGLRSHAAGMGKRDGGGSQADHDEWRDVSCGRATAVEQSRGEGGKRLNFGCRFFTFVTARMLVRLLRV